MKRLVRVAGESMAPTYRSSDRECEQQVGRAVGGGHGLAGHPDETLHAGVLVLFAVAVFAVAVAFMPVVLMILTLGVLEEADVSGKVAAAGGDVVHVEVLDGHRGVEALVEFGAALLRHHR